jgi:hypothetical protein
VIAAKPASSAPRCPTAIPPRSALTSAPPVPPGWALTAVPAAKKCGNLSRNEWVAHAAAGVVEVALREKGTAEDPLPFKVSGKARDGLGGTRHVRAVDDGWLVGFDAAEVGGALWWFDMTGERRVKLSDGNIIGFVELGGEGVVALSGFARGGFSRGQALRVRRAGEWTATRWIDLDSAAEAFALESRDSLLVLTTTGIFRVTACGDVTRVALADYDALYPTSLAVDPHGVIYVGMRHYVTRFLPVSGSKLREEWLTRENCQKAEVRHFECVCAVDRGLRP